jgi:rhodanese-related sulfurtransferase
MVQKSRKTMKRTILQSWLLLTLIALLLAACQPAQKETGPVEVEGKEVPVAGGSYRDISPEELKAMLEDKDFSFINVHIPFEGDIAGTDLSIPYNEIDQNLEKLPQDTNAKIVLYCRSDRMSRIASENLVERGYANIWNLDGGMVAWERAGYELTGR